MSFKESIFEAFMSTRIFSCIVPQFFQRLQLFLGTVPELRVQSTAFFCLFVLFSEMFFFKPSPCDEAHRPQCSTCIHVFICVCNKCPTISMGFWCHNGGQIFASAGPPIWPPVDVLRVLCSCLVNAWGVAVRGESIGAPSSCLSWSARPGSPGGRGRWTRRRG